MSKPRRLRSKKRRKRLKKSRRRQKFSMSKTGDMTDAEVIVRLRTDAKLRYKIIESLMYDYAKKYYFFEILNARKEQEKRAKERGETFTPISWQSYSTPSFYIPSTEALLLWTKENKGVYQALQRKFEAEYPENWEKFFEIGRLILDFDSKIRSGMVLTTGEKKIYRKLNDPMYGRSSLTRIFMREIWDALTTRESSVEKQLRKIDKDLKEEREERERTIDLRVTKLISKAFSEHGPGLPSDPWSEVLGMLAKEDDVRKWTRLAFGRSRRKVKKKSKKKSRKPRKY